jgi:hypothetical protein
MRIQRVLYALCLSCLMIWMPTPHPEVSAFVPLIQIGCFGFHKSLKKSDLFMNTNDYLNDVGKSNPDGNDGTDTGATTSTDGSSPTNDYLDDSAYKHPENYLDDMGTTKTNAAVSNAAPPSVSSNGYLSDTPASSSRLDGANAILVEIDTVERYEEPTEDPFAATTTANTAVTFSSEEALIGLLQIASRTGRGELATSDEKRQAEEFVSILEANNPTQEPTKSSLINGRWELLYTSTQLFRSSPFFMAGRAVCTTVDQAQQYDWFCDMHRRALAISNIGAVRQIISPTLLVSEFEVKVGAIPFFNFTPLTPFPYSGGLPFTIDGAIVSSADIKPTASGKEWELYMDTVQIRGSNVPGLRTILDERLQLDSRQLATFLEENVDGYTTPRPIFETTFLSNTLRISRDQDGKVFVYQKVSESCVATDYSRVDADLGFLKFLEGLNDNIIKYYE